MEKKDLVCGMSLDDCKEKSDYKGKTYCFCSEDCRKQFEKSPDKFIRS